MAKIQLTISTDYQRNWGVWEGIRELVANGFDAETEYNAPCTIEHKPKIDTMYITNEGVVLPLKALLMGHSSKMDRGDTIGQFGEGLKVGILALIRKGVGIKIRTGSEVWVPSLEWSEKFGADVLTFDVQTGRADENRVRVEIQGVNKDAWATLKARFLRLQKLKEDTSVKVPYHGTLLLSDDMKGKVFCRGIFIKELTNLNYGYDFDSGTLNRDRDIMDDLDCRTKGLWADAAGLRPDLLKPFYKMIEDQDTDVRGINEWNTYQLPETLKDSMAAQFTERFGAGVIPVASMGESKDAEHFGQRSAVVNKAMLAILSTRLDTFEKVKEKAKDEVTARFSWGDLTELERNNLTNASEALKAATDCDVLAITDVAEFRSPTLEGLHKDGKITLARKMLADEADTLGVLIHEWSHFNGADGDKSHVYTIETTWAKVYRAKLGKV